MTIRFIYKQFLGLLYGQSTFYQYKNNDFYRRYRIHYVCFGKYREYLE